MKQTFVVDLKINQILLLISCFVPVDFFTEIYHCLIVHEENFTNQSAVKMMMMRHSLSAGHFAQDSNDGQIFF